MYQKKNPRDGKVSFAVRAQQAQQGFVAGDFTNWKPVAMHRKAGGGFEMTLPVSPGVYQYKFLLDGRWVVDPDNSSFAISPIGTINSVAHLD